MKKLCALLLMFAASCANPHAAAHEAIYDAVADEYRAYVEADPNASSDPAWLQRRLDTIETWRRLVKGVK